MSIIIAILGIVIIALLWYAVRLERKLERLNIFSNSFPMRDFANIKVGDNFICYHRSFVDESIAVKYKLISLPDNKFQLVRVNNKDKITGISNMGIKDTIEEVIHYLKDEHFCLDHELQ